MASSKYITVQVNDVTAMYDPRTDRINHSEFNSENLKDIIEALYAIDYLIARDKPLTF